MPAQLSDTDYDVWRVSEAPVTVDMVIQTLNNNTRLAEETVRNLVVKLNSNRLCNCSHALADALITQRKAIPQKTIDKLDLLVRKYMGD